MEEYIAEHKKQSALLEKQTHLLEEFCRRYGVILDHGQEEQEAEKEEEEGTKEEVGLVKWAWGMWRAIWREGEGGVGEKTKGEGAV